APLLASRRSWAASERGPRKMRLVTIVCDTPAVSELNPASAPETTTKAARADPTTAPQRTGRRSGLRSAEQAGRIGCLVVSTGPGSAPDAPQPEQGEQQWRAEDRESPDARAPQPDDAPARLRHHRSDLPGRRAVQAGKPRVTRVVRVALGTDERLAAAPHDRDHPVRLHVLVADRDVVADHLSDADVLDPLGRHHDQV